MSDLPPKSKKHSDTSSSCQPPKHSFFVDICLGNTVALGLRAAGECVYLHKDLAAYDAKDHEWLPSVSAKGLIILTRDKNFRNHQNEMAALKRAHSRAFVITCGAEMTGAQLLEFVKERLQQMKEFADKTEPPFVARVNRTEIVPYDLDKRCH